MRFENAIVAMRKGYKVQRKSLKKRLNAIRLFIENDALYSEQTHELSQHKVDKVYGISYNMLMAEDWEATK